jgi:AcrR family transcriptional regulator
VRADARDNRARILAAADEVFDRAGPAGSTEEVAKLAGVGIATVFRHFPTKPDLVGAVLTRRLERIRDRASELAATGPGSAFFDFFTEVVEGAASKLALAEVASPSESAQRAGAEMRKAFANLLARAQQDGAVRADVEAAEVYALMIGASRGTTHASVDPDVRTRMLALIFTSLRPPPQSPA